MASKVKEGGVTKDSDKIQRQDTATRDRDGETRLKRSPARQQRAEHFTSLPFFGAFCHLFPKHKYSR